VLERDDFSPELCTVVREGEEIVAGTICRPERLGVPWIARLFTRREWRRRGVGEVLLYDAFGQFWRRGRRTVGLGVDAQSDTGAQRLYERVGMHVHWGAVVFDKEVG
jgi:mycothiol synthase